MGKRRKKQPEANEVDFTEKFDDIIENISKEIRNMKKSNTFLIIGTNAVLRGLEASSLSIVMLNSDKASSAIYHSLKLWCKKTDVLFISLKTDSELLQDKKLLASTTFGVKKNALCMNQKLSDLLTKINRLKRSKKFEQNVTGSTMHDKSVINDEALEETNKFEGDSNVVEQKLEGDYYHSKCIFRSTKLKNENFLSLETNLEPNVEFMNYKRHSLSNFHICVK